jgi:hypothetical protein
MSCVRNFIEEEADIPVYSMKLRYGVFGSHHMSKTDSSKFQMMA